MIKLVTILLFFSFVSTAQIKTRDSIKVLLENERIDSNRIFYISKLSDLYKDENPIIGLSYAQQGIVLARKIQFLKGEATCLNSLGNNYRRIGEFTKGLQAHFDALKIFERLDDIEGLTISNHGISVSYEDREEYSEALAYAYKVIPTAIRLKNYSELMRIQSNMGKIYHDLGQSDSALHYEQNAYEIAINTKDSAILGNILSRLGNIYRKMNNPDMALAHYKMGIPIATARNDNNSLTELYFAMAKLFQQQSNFDSAVNYAKLDLHIASQMPVPAEIVNASILLTSIYDKLNKDSAYKYLTLATITKDSLFNNEKIKQLQVLAFEEEKRQAEIDQKKIREKEEQSHNLQYMALGILILTSVILFLLLSSSIIANEKWIKFLSIVILLVAFEFINLLLHPGLASITNHSPSLMLLAMVAIASVLIPFHHKLEKWIQIKMIEKNKKIRLAAAKKTIAKLEKESSEDSA